jgi:hypothetical protein
MVTTTNIIGEALVFNDQLSVDDVNALYTGGLVHSLGSSRNPEPLPACRECDGCLSDILTNLAMALICVLAHVFGNFWANVKSLIV